MRYLYVCEKCGFSVIGNSNNYQCSNCSNILTKTKYNENLLLKIDISSSAFRKRVADVYCKQPMIMIPISKKIDNNDQLQSIEEPVRCPKCGSTQIQVLRKKWSPLTGIFTNKVERVCVNCKKRF